MRLTTPRTPLIFAAISSAIDLVSLESTVPVKCTKPFSTPTRKVKPFSILFENTKRISLRIFSSLLYTKELIMFLQITPNSVYCLDSPVNTTFIVWDYLLLLEETPAFFFGELTEINYPFYVNREG